MDIKIINDALAAAAAWFGLIDKYGWRKGGIVSVVALAVLVILLKFLAKKDKKQEESSAVQSVGEGAATPDEMEFEDITHIRPAQSVSGEQSVGKNAKAGKKMSFKKIRQEMK